MSRFDFVGPSYASQSPNADDEICMNFYVEQMESPSAKSALALYPTPGSSLFCTLAGASVNQMICFNGRAFATSGNQFYELFANKSFTARGPIAFDGPPASLAAGPNQILVASGGAMYVFDLTANTLTPVDPATYVGPVSQVAYVDGFFLALFRNSGEFQVSALDDATSWDLTNVAIISVFADNIIGMETIYRQTCFLGPKQSVFYYDSGNTFPFDVVQNGFIEQGLAAPFASSVLDNSIFTLSQDLRGQGMAYRINGYSPVRVSNFAVEFAWSKYTTIADAISYAYQDQGHNFWVVYFPTPSKTWVYDCSSGFWHERNFWNGGNPIAHRSQCYMLAFGKHLVGDWKTGSIYEMSLDYLDDFGNPIRRHRRAPAISTELQRMTFHRLDLDMEVGLGPQPPLLDGSGNPRDPEVTLTWSRDGAHTFSNGYTRGVGQAGKFAQTVHWDRLGMARQLVFDLTCTDPIPLRIVNAYLLASPDFTKQERYSSQVRKVS